MLDPDMPLSPRGTQQAEGGREVAIRPSIAEVGDGAFAFTGLRLVALRTLRSLFS